MVEVMLDKLRDKWFWFKFDLEIYIKGLPISYWCFKEFIKTKDLGYLHDAIKGLIP